MSGELRLEGPGIGNLVASLAGLTKSASSAEFAVIGGLPVLARLGERSHGGAVSQGGGVANRLDPAGSLSVATNPRSCASVSMSSITGTSRVRPGVRVPWWRCTDCC